MSLNKPYSPYQANEALYAFVKYGLKNLGIEVVENNGALFIEVNDEERELLSLPTPGRYILKFSPQSLKLDQAKPVNSRRVQ